MGNINSNRNTEFKVWWDEIGWNPLRNIPVIRVNDLPRDIIHKLYLELIDVMPPLDIMCPHLTHLSIEGIKRSHSLDCMKSLTELQVLHISWNDFSKGLPDVVTLLTTLRELYMSNCQLKDLPQSIQSLQKLQKLDVGQNNFAKGLPDVVTLLTTLKELHLSQCHLKDLPQSMKSLTQLQVLDISRIVFSKGLPDVVTELTTLRELNLYYCDLKDLPQSMKSLTELQVLDISTIVFSKGLPDVVTILTTLRELHSSRCGLTDLPQSLHLLSHLVKLDISYNYFTTLPPVIYQLSNLEKLIIIYNQPLQTITADILKLSKLEQLDCDGCESLVTPPFAVCEQGLPAIKKYFEDLRDEAGTELAVIPVAVVGNLMAGKTSLIRSLKVGRREFTFRHDNSPLDETTRVFSMESIQLTNSLVKLIDFGGHSIYHLAYQLTVKQQCIPMIVINLEEYDKMSSERGVKEATRRLCIDWMSHLYLACPRLGAPVLILTHRDKLLSDEQFDLTKHHILTTAEMIRKKLLEEERECSENLSEFCQILHLSNLNKPLFDPADIFVFGKDSTVTTNIQNVKDCLENRCDEFKMAIPRLWERVKLYIDEEVGKPYVLLSDVKAEFRDSQQMEVILRYLHNSGKVLWFENKPTLAAYIFHQLPEITKMIAVLFHHSGDERWEERIDNVTGFRHKDRFIEKQMFEKLVNQFKRDGVLNEAVLMYLMKEESKFPIEIAVELLSTFHIIHGPIQQEIGTGYIIPYFSKKYMDRDWLSDGDVQLRLDIEFNGLPIPKYVYHLMTVIALNFQTDSTHLQKVASNGVTIRHGFSSTHLIHDYNNNKVTLQISTPVKLIGPSWRRLLEFAQHIVNKTIEVWKASRPVFRFYCSHCLYIRVDNPDTTINPGWFTCAQQHSPHDHPRSVRTFTGVEPVPCARAETSNGIQLTVLKPLRFPCYELTDEEISKLEKYLSKLRESYPLSTTEIRRFDTSTTASEDESEDDADSVCSDIVEAGYADFTNPELEFNICNLVDLKPTSRRKVKSLFYNTNEVYQMTDPVRGRVMIINNQVFFKGRKLVDNRQGSDIDYDNISSLFTDMDFKIVKEEDPMTDLTKEEIFSELRQETQLSDHHALGMFVLVILSHGTRGGIFLDTNCQPVDLVDVKDLLSASKFPAMKGKPKIIIVHACSGERLDFGDAVDPQEVSSSTAAGTTLVTPTPATTTATPATATPATTLVTATPATPSTATPTPATATTATTSPATTATPATTTSSSVPQEVKPHIDLSKLTYLDADDFYIMKPSTESYKAMRSKRYGTWFIRILVATFYKHSCHMDIERLFKIVQARVRAASIAYGKEKGKANVGGDVPSSPDCTFTHLRKLYLFPKYSGT